MLSEEKLNELCAKELLELDRHTYGYANAGKDINAVLDRYVIAYKSGYRAAELDAQELADCLNNLVEEMQVFLSVSYDYHFPDAREAQAKSKSVLSKWLERGV